MPEKDAAGREAPDRADAGVICGREGNGTGLPAGICRDPAGDESTIDGDMSDTSLKGFVEHITYRSDETGYTVLTLNVEGEDVTAVGVLPEVGEGETLECEGRYMTHPTYGEQFRIESFTVGTPEDAAAMERYLSSGLIKGIGKALAHRIVKRFGDDTFSIVEEQPERLAEISGISPRKAQEIASQIVEKKDQRDGILFLQKYGISNTLALRIYKAYGPEVYRIIRENPYRLADEMTGVGFRTADEIARHAGMKADSDFRVRSGILYTLQLSQGEGNIYLPEEVLLRRCAGLLGFDGEAGLPAYPEMPFPGDMNGAAISGVGAGAGAPGAADRYRELMEDSLRNLAVDRRIVVRQEEDQVRVYEARMYYMEVNCARMLTDLNVQFHPAQRQKGAAPERWQEAAGGLQKSVSGVQGRKKGRQECAQGGQEAAGGCQEYPPGVQGNPEVCVDGQTRRLITEMVMAGKTVLDEKQLQAVLMAESCGVMILTGGPGTGKTTTINTMIGMFEREGLKIALAAPTGRAARRMTEATGHEARTIHRLLEVSGDPEEGAVSFGRNTEEPLEEDVVIIDEMSMVDLPLLSSLLKAIPVGTRLIMVGDASQLPSVGPGSVLRDMIASRTIPTVTLTTIFRQARESDIVMNAHKINRGEHPDLGSRSRDFFFMRRDRAEDVVGLAIKLVRDNLPKYVGAPSSDIQVMTPMKKGLVGTIRLNQLMQHYLNPQSRAKREWQRGDTIFREGDRVMQIRNNYQKEWLVRGRYGAVTDQGTGVYNGDMGIVKEISPHTDLMTVEFDEHRCVEYEKGDLDELELAYAVTIHKAQGSEYPAVVIPMLRGPRMLMNRNLLYTAVTRAKKCVVIIGDPDVMNDMIDNTNEARRYTTLALRLKTCARSAEEEED